MEPLPGDFPCYWAPEVAYFEGASTFITASATRSGWRSRSAVADHPAGPFVDSGRRLTPSPSPSTLTSTRTWTIRDGSSTPPISSTRATSARAPSATVCSTPSPWRGTRVPSPCRATTGTSITRTGLKRGRALAHRRGAVRAPAQGRALRDVQRRQLAEPHLRRELCHDTKFPRSVPVGAGRGRRGGAAHPALRGKVVGPGHNSVVRGPDNRQLSASITAGQPTRRTGSWRSIRSTGPGSACWSWGPRPRRNPPEFAHHLDLLDAPAVLQPGEAVRYATGSPSFLVEVSVRGGAGWNCGDGEASALLARAAEAFRLLRLEVDGSRVSLSSDEGVPLWRGKSSGMPPLSLAAEEAPAVSGFALTLGWESLFEDDGDPGALGWEILDGGAWRVEKGGSTARGPPGSRKAPRSALVS